MVGAEPQDAEVAEASHPSGAGIALAPVGVLRVAAWPVEALDAFGSPELFDAATSLLKSRRSSASLAAFETLYEAVIARESDALWARTAGDTRFMKALALANPALLERVRVFLARHPDRPRSKRGRHLETSLYRLLARAVGRTEPFGAWAGVSHVASGTETSLRQVAPTRFVTPNLAFFGAALRALAVRPGVRRQARYRLNPTLGRQEDGSWAYWSPPPHTGRGRGVVPPSPLLDAVFGRLRELEAFTIADAERALLAPEHGLDAFVFEELLPQGIVLGGLGLPPFFTDPWDALDQIAEMPVPDRSRWMALTGELRAICGQIEDRYDALDLDGLLAQGESAAAAGQAFATALGLDGLPRLELAMDSTSGFELTLGADLRARLAQQVAEDEADTSGSFRAYNERLRRAQCARLGPEGIPLAGLPEDVFAHLGSTAGWPEVGREAYFPEWPLRTVLAELALGDRGTAKATAITPLDDAASPIARFVTCLARRSAEPTNDLVAWLRRAHTECFAGPGPRLVALGSPNAHAPNAAAQPDFGIERRSLWGITDSLAGVRIVGLADRGLVALRDPARTGGDLDKRREAPPFGVVGAEPQDFAIAPMSALNLASGDPVLQLLLMSSMRFPRPAEPPATADEPGPPPRGVASKVQGAERFLAWCAANLPEAGEPHRGHVIVRRPDVPPLRIPVTSPLAVAALLEGAEDLGRAIVEPVTTTPFVAGETGHHVAQLVLPFRRA